ncbi:T6SS immunity protein Tli4 family protein [Massilia sp. 9096]|uniref:T6SS immunity protein Tli4 family protein n=1 Tax=Massilia sp. 9096 TaxID=1500894 RepID=UPI000560EBF9|nr:T6SS immunity protein Tli4 family protein [Massilia sp. 9096]
MTEKTKTVCVGRYLVDVPAQAAVSLSGGMLDGFDIATTEEDEASFRARIAAREAEIVSSAAAVGRDGPGGIIEARDLRVPGMAGRFFVYGRTRTHGFEGEQRVESEFVSVESHGHTGGLSFSLHMKYAYDNDIKAAEALLTRLRVRGEDEIPQAPGFCIRRGVFLDPLPEHKNEHMVMHLGVPAHPDLAMVLFSIAGGNAEPGLLARVAHTDAASSADDLLRVSRLRSDRRKINGLDGEELVERVREYNFTTGYAFNWETSGAGDDVLRPYLSLEMQTGVSERPGGKPTDTSLHEDALLALWDSISSSIRLRRSEPPSPSGPPPEPPGPKPGAVVHAGQTCPQTGWWQCDAGGHGLDVHGGSVQFLRKGDRMHQALLLPRQSLWQKVKRIQPSMESDKLTAWTLVDKRHRPRNAPAVALAQPGAPAASLDLTADLAPAVALGAYARTGEVCPASGWWRCEELHALDGARWFARGSVLPPATFQVPTGVFARPGGPEFIQRRSAWQLVRLTDMRVGSEAPLSGLPLSGMPLSGA